MAISFIELPTEILQLIFLFLTPSELPFSLCKQVYHCLDQYSFWIQLCKQWSTENFTIAPLDSTTNMKKYFIENLYLKRQVFVNLKCQFNENYVCKLYQIIFGKDTFEVYFHVHGDMSLGVIQKPQYSWIRIEEREEDVVLGWVYVRSYHNSPHVCKIISQDDYHIHGILTFRMKLVQGGKYLFQYGEGGYSTCVLFHLTEEYLLKNRISHLIKKNTQ